MNCHPAKEQVPLSQAWVQNQEVLVHDAILEVDGDSVAFLSS